MTATVISSDSEILEIVPRIVPESTSSSLLESLKANPVTVKFDPKMVEGLIGTDPQLILPSLIMQHVPVFAQVMFFGALLSAIKSTSSATLLAPSTSFVENILKNLRPHMGDRQQLLATRWTIQSLTTATCAASLVVPSLGIRMRLNEGPNTIDLPALPPGTLAYTCSMGMYGGQITVVERPTGSTGGSAPGG